MALKLMRPLADTEACAQAQPALFDAYHQGFRAQVATWHNNPVDIAVAWLRSKPNVKTIADFGCGDAQIAQELSSTHTVLSFDLVAANKRVTACTLSAVPCEAGMPDLPAMYHCY